MTGYGGASACFGQMYKIVLGCHPIEKYLYLLEDVFKNNFNLNRSERI